MQTSREQQLAAFIANYQYCNPELTEREITSEFERIEALSDREFLKWRISEAEKNKADYEALMKDVGMNRENYGIKGNPEFYEGYKAMLREQLNEVKHTLKLLQEDMYYLNQGMNPPFCYPDVQKERKKVAGLR
jgi:succinate dehydrogenase flavin-adding protein (antitoxin of CptAB toxin-antitoxin module)